MAKQITSESELNFESVVIDDDAKVIRNVILCGNESKNGYAYPPECFKNLDHVVSLYEGRPVCINHNLENPGVRDVRDVAGFLRNVRFEAGKPVGDIEVESAINCGVDLMALAKKGRKGIGMSHTARCKMSRDKKTVELVEAVLTVDVVVNPATTTTFFEQEQDMELEQLKAELATVTAECAVLKHELDSAKKLVDGHKSESDKLLIEVTTLRADLQEVKPKLEKFEQEAKAAADKLAIEAQLVLAGLDVKDTLVVSEQFITVLLSAGPEDRTKIIDDRKALIEGASKNDRGVVSLPRQIKTEQKTVPGQLLKNFLGKKEAN